MKTGTYVVVNSLYIGINLQHLCFIECGGIVVDEMVEKHSNNLWALLEEQLVYIITFPAGALPVMNGFVFVQVATHQILTIALLG